MYDLIAHGTLIKSIVLYIIALAVLRGQVCTITDRIYIFDLFIDNVYAKDRHQDMIDLVSVNVFPDLFDQPY